MRHFPEDEFLGRNDREENRAKHIEDGLVQTAELTDPLAIRVMDSQDLTLRYLHQYDDHGDNYNDRASKAFIGWWMNNPKAAEISKKFVASCLDSRDQQRANCDTHLFLSKFVSWFNESGFGLFDSPDVADKLIPEFAAPRLARMYNVWYRENFPADGENLFATKRFSTRPEKACSVCGSYYDPETGETVLGDEYLRITGKD